MLLNSHSSLCSFNKDPSFSDTGEVQLQVPPHAAPAPRLDAHSVPSTRYHTNLKCSSSLLPPKRCLSYCFSHGRTVMPIAEMQTIL